MVAIDHPNWFKLVPSMSQYSVDELDIGIHLPYTLSTG
jgi:hypothetical protein